MWYDEDSEEDAQQNIGLMSGKTTEKNPNYEKKGQMSIYSNVLDDEDFEEWIEKWNTIDKNEKLGHTQELFRMLLSNDATTYYYSFCENDVFEEDCNWFSRTLHMIY
ncbi:unnamed protein product [Rotaria sordida]|uniref:Uncharacterized protein n=1 Tax=Rotaria sordida TaxID=392033 RepID=A0A819ES07_9BILA|nr:unnamed protein product [Rotaria sordida]CAF3854531.1 unnamed protein product [Rotaria sordida]